MNGHDFIYAERRRQILQEGWTLKQDDSHTDESLFDAALIYEKIGALQAENNTLPVFLLTNLNLTAIRWPWDDRWFKPGKFAIRTFTKAGALYQAEVERLERKISLRLSWELPLSDQADSDNRALKRAQEARNRAARWIDRLLS